jgi:hypothetical protein
LGEGQAPWTGKPKAPDAGWVAPKGLFWGILGGSGPSPRGTPGTPENPEFPPEIPEITPVRRFLGGKSALLIIS